MSPASLGFGEGVVPSTWTPTPLSELLIERSVRAQDVVGGIGFAILSLTKDRGLIEQNERFGRRIARDDVAGYKVVERGWIAYNPMVLWEGAIHQLRDRPFGLVSPVYAVWQPTFRADGDYLDLLLKTRAALVEYERLASGVVKRRRVVSKQAFLDMVIGLPPLAEQRAIADVLRTVQNALEATGRVIAAAREVRRRLREHLLRSGSEPDDEPGRDEALGAHNGATTASGGTTDLSDLLREPLRNGMSALPTNTNHGIRTLTLSAVTQDDFSIKNTKLTKAHAGAVAGLWLEPGDIFIERANTRELVGTAALYEGPSHFAIYPDLLIRVRPNTGRVDPKFLVEWLRTASVRRLLSSSASGTAGSMPKIGHDVVGRIPVALPPFSDQVRIASAMRAADRKIAVELSRQHALRSLFDTLRDDLMSARLRVHEADRTVPAS